MNLLKVWVHCSYSYRHIHLTWTPLKPFSSAKSYLKANEAILQVSGDIESVLLVAFANISADDCRAWFRDSGYY